MARETGVSSAGDLRPPSDFNPVIGIGSLTALDRSSARASLVAASIFLSAIGALTPTRALAQVGSIEGRVTFEAAPPSRRTANRYPGGASAGHEVHALPAVVYIVGHVEGAGTAPGGAPVMTQRDTAFVPRVVAVRAGSSVTFPNGDPFFHNVFSYSSAQRFDLGRYPQGESKSVAFPEPGIIEVFCEVHEFMRGAILVTESPFHAVVAPDDSFRIPGVPPGEYTVAIWHPDHEAVERRVTVVAGAPARVEVELTR
jgi:plastocyanin